jgi:hypothetical protein
LTQFYNFRVACKYILTAAGISNALARIWQIPLRLAYNAQGAENGRACAIVVTPEQAEFL